MRLRWFGQSAFSLSGSAGTIVVDPFGEMPESLRARHCWDYPAVSGVDADLLLVTHEHADHNAVEVVGGDPHTIRSTTGTWDTPLGQVVGIASEHDEVAGTQRGSNTIFVFELDGIRVAHFGDFGQAALRDEQAAVLGSVDLLIVPIGSGPTIGAIDAYAIGEKLSAKWVIPMHYRTARTNFLEPVDAFLALFGDRVTRAESVFELEDVAPGVVVPAAP